MDVNSKLESDIQPPDEHPKWFSGSFIGNDGKMQLGPAEMVAARETRAKG